MLALKSTTSHSKHKELQVPGLLTFDFITFCVIFRGHSNIGMPQIPIKFLRATAKHLIWENDQTFSWVLDLDVGLRVWFEGFKATILICYYCLLFMLKTFKKASMESTPCVCVCFSSSLFCNHAMSKGSLQPNNQVCRLTCLVLHLQIYPCNYFIRLQATFACIFIFSLYFIIPFSVIVICSFM